MKVELNKIYKMKNYTWYVQVVEIYKPERYWYNQLKKELGIKTNATIIKYNKSTSKEFIFWLVNYMKLSDFKNNHEIIC